MQLDRPVGWEPGDGAWTLTILATTDVPVQPETLAIWQGKLLIGGHDLWLFDPATLVWQRVWRPPLPSEADANHRYSWGGNYDEWVRCVRVHAGVIYVSFCLYAHAANSQDGVYASSDGVHFVALWRDIADDLGLRMTKFEAQGRVYGYRNDAAGVNQVVSFPAVSPALVNALRIERGEANVITNAMNSDFVGWVVGNNNFYGYGGTTGVAVKGTGGGMHGDEYLKVAGTGSYGFAYLPRYYHFCSTDGGDSPVFAAPAAGQKVIVEAWIKVVSCPANWTWELYFSGGAGEVGVAWDHAAVRYIGTGKWVCLRRTGRVTGPPTKIKTLAISGLGSSGAFEFHVDCVRVLYVDDWTDGTAWQIGGTARTNEQASISLAGCVGTENHYDWALLFGWHPGEGWAAFTADVPIVSLDGGGGVWVDLSYQVSTSRFLLKCGETEYTSGIVKFRHFDDLRFALSTSPDGEDMQLFLWDPVNGAEQVGLEGLGLANPVSARFGRDNTGAIFGVGLFHSLGIRGEEISAAEFIDMCARPGWSWNRLRARLTCTRTQR
jgi:hypothetical protein